MSEKTDVRQGTIAMVILKTPEALGPLRGYGIARRIEQASENKLAVDDGTIYPPLMKLEQEADIASELGASDHNRKATAFFSCVMSAGTIWSGATGRRFRFHLKPSSRSILSRMLN